MRFQPPVGGIIKESLFNQESTYRVPVTHWGPIENKGEDHPCHLPTILLLLVRIQDPVKNLVTVVENKGENEGVL